METSPLRRKDKKDIKIENWKGHLVSINLKIKYLSIIILLIIFAFFIVIYTFNYIKIKNLSNELKETKISINKLSSIINTMNKSISTIDDPMSHHISMQKDFCKNSYKYYDSLIEKNIKIQNVNFKSLSFNMYVYKEKDWVSREISRDQKFESNETLAMLEALDYYTKKKNITNNKDIYMLDIGGNIGWYPSVIGKFGYTILSFEALYKNYYVSLKNYCLSNQNSNAVIINLGLGNEEQICDYYYNINNIGNGMVSCEGIKDQTIKKNFNKTSIVTITKLSNYESYLNDKNLALIKIDVEGMEGKVIEGGIDLIKKRHVPFIMLEYTPRALADQGTNPMEFLNFFIECGYKIKIDKFINGTDASFEFIKQKNNSLINLFFIYEGI